MALRDREHVLHGHKPWAKKPLLLPRKGTRWGGGHWVVVKVGQREDPDRQALSLVLFQLLRHPS